MNYRAALFDFDGTLSPSLPLWVRAFDIALRAFGIELSDQDIVQRLFRRDWGESLKELRIDSTQEFRAQVSRGLRVAFKEAQLFPDVTDVLTACRQAGVQVALVTSAPKFVLDDVMPRLGLRDFFDHIVCADDVVNFKPHPEPVTMTLAALGCKPDRAIMIGDSSVDILAGKAAGTATALFLPCEQTSFHHVEALKATEPDHIFASHDELRAILGVAH